MKTAKMLSAAEVVEKIRDAWLMALGVPGFVDDAIAEVERLAASGEWDPSVDDYLHALERIRATVRAERSSEVRG